MMGLFGRMPMEWNWNSVMTQAQASMKHMEEVGSSVMEQSIKHADVVSTVIVEQTKASFETSATSRCDS